MKPMLIAIGFVAACVFTGCSTLQERRSAEYDQTRHVPIVRSHAGNGFVMLYDYSFDCREGKRAAYVQLDLAVWLGCWVETPTGIRIEFEDGEVVTGPPLPKQEGKPARSA